MLNLIKFLAPKKLVKSRKFFIEVALALILLKSVQSDSLKELAEANFREVCSFIRNLMISNKDNEDFIYDFTDKLLFNKELELDVIGRVFDEYRDLIDDYDGEIVNLNINGIDLGKMTHEFFKKVLDKNITYDELLKNFRD